MNKFTLPFRALLLGFVIEASDIALFSTSDFGPCGPSNPLGFVVPPGCNAGLHLSGEGMHLVRQALLERRERECLTLHFE